VGLSRRRLHSEKYKNNNMSSNIFVWYLISLFEGVLVPWSIIYMIGYLVLHALPPFVLQSFLHLLPVDQLLEQSHVFFFIALFLFCISFFIIQPFSAIPVMENKRIKQNRVYFERFLLFAGVMITMRLMFQQAALQKDLIAVEKRSYLAEDRISSLFQKMEERDAQFEAKTKQLKKEIEDLKKKFADFNSGDGKSTNEKQVLKTVPQSRQNMEVITTSSALTTEPEEEDLSRLITLLQIEYKTTYEALQSSVKDLKENTSALKNDASTANNKLVDLSNQMKALVESPYYLESHILLWFNEDIPIGYRVCDGKDGKIPDLRNRFLIGAERTKRNGETEVTEGHYALHEKGGNIESYHSFVTRLADEELPSPSSINDTAVVNTGNSRNMKIFDVKATENHNMELFPPFHAVYFLCRENK
jgi:predicted  nucleic acid-binding Zn-ribbon protein